MSRKSNTLYNYFAKVGSSPSVQTERKNEQRNTQIEEKCDSISGKRNLSEDEAEEVIKGTQKKRRRIKSESDSSSDHETSTNNKSKVSKIAGDHRASQPVPVKEGNQKPTKLENGNKAPEEIGTQSGVWPHNKLEFLKRENIKDANGKRPNDDDYDGRTLYVPQLFLNGLSPGVRQWWELKSRSFDCILFFKVGKFYELYHMDADIGVRELGLTYMKGDFAHTGFPEISYEKMAASVIDKGYKVARVEQTETPDMMTQRVKLMSQPTKFDKVVKREICQITNLGTQVPRTLEYELDYRAKYMLAIAEKVEPSGNSYGVCIADTTMGEFMIGEFKDDKHSSRLLTLIAHYRPVLVISKKRDVSMTLHNIMKTSLLDTIKETIPNDAQIWNATNTLKLLAEKYFLSKDGVLWPDTIKNMQSEDDHRGLTSKNEFQKAFEALGACIWYLRKCLIDEQVLQMANFDIYIPLDNMKKEQNSNQKNRSMVLDSITLSNLQIFGGEHSLQCALDRCCTKFGKRLLQRWLCTPTGSIEEIKLRQSAILELVDKAYLTNEIRAEFTSMSDFERYLVQINAFGIRTEYENHPDSRAILFEEKTYNKRQIQDFISTINGLENLISISQKFADFSSKLIVKLTQLEPEGQFPSLRKLIYYFKTAFNFNLALEEGIIAPAKGIDEEYDLIELEMQKLQDEMQQYLREQQKYFGCKVEYFGNDKKRFQLEVLESHCRKADSRYFLEGQKKGAHPVRRFHTTITKEFLKKTIELEEEKNKVLKSTAGRIFLRFSQHHNTWKKAVEHIAYLDVLMSLAVYTKNYEFVCAPEISESNDSPFIEIEDAYHPCLTSADNFIPNNISFGGDKSPVVLLTGPNMGGKSTLMRQVALIAIMSQMGALVPAKSCRMSLVDRVFTRLGAQDDILTGHSTFLVELNEAASILKYSTKRSLILLDELGRGTATYDGTAIAASVVQFLIDLGCRSLFSTHYHNLIDYFRNEEKVILGHMACMVESEESVDDPTMETITFLYKYSAGACPKSYGFNAAKLAGMPDIITRRAYSYSKSLVKSVSKKKMFSQMLSNQPLSSIVSSVKSENW